MPDTLQDIVASEEMLEAATIKEQQYITPDELYILQKTEQQYKQALAQIQAPLQSVIAVLAEKYHLSDGQRINSETGEILSGETR